MEKIIIHPDNPQPRLIKRGVDALKSGKLIIYPTDTIYGMGCSIYQKKTIEQLYKIKGKSKFQSMTLLCESIHQAANYVQIPNSTYRILKRCLPGSFTVVLAARREITKLMLSRQKEIGVRIPNNRVCRMLIESLGHPILNTSASDEPDFLMNNSPNNEDIAELMFDAGEVENPGFSTVIRIIDNGIEVLREGKGDLEMLPSYS